MLFKKTLRKWLRNILNSDELTLDSAIQVPNGSPFSKDFDGWNFRIHRASGGHVIEVWQYNNNPTPYAMKASQSGPEHKLFIIGTDEELSVELPQILTQLALGR